MRASNIHVALLLLLALVASEPSHAFDLVPKFHVNVFNDLSNNTLYLHCQSKDDDLGNQELMQNKHFHFQFRINWKRTTLFWCHFAWGNFRGGTYNVFWAKKNLVAKCDYDYKHCNWSERDDGLYLQNYARHAEWVKYYDWKH
ncbi:hypothetical protein P3X46_027604 [Hevea brasiliensis]|uniref:S-protein homolog n=1 Tax=Hevea brasiliensis TaxID=3981 RepID=A0ABQ9L0B3_HEVBR|nr:S-protein homolog 29-like [Hevea brasiliensis]KAJ9154248.1 hypothetical protein P3X46_027604 [Hevea brasiliensis]